MKTTHFLYQDIILSLFSVKYFGSLSQTQFVFQNVDLPLNKECENYKE